MITPIEIQSKTFKSGGLGYDKKDVDGFLREVLRSYETVYRENMELTDKVSVLTEGIQYYKTIEKTLQKALVLAEKTAEDTRIAAEEKAKSIEREARSRSQMIVSDAKNELERIHNQTIQLIQQYEKYKVQFKKLAEAQMELIESEPFNISVARLDSFIPAQETAKTEKESQPVKQKVETEKKQAPKAEPEKKQVNKQVVHKSKDLEEFVPSPEDFEEEQSEREVAVTKEAKQLDESDFDVEFDTSFMDSFGKEEEPNTNPKEADDDYDYDDDEDEVKEEYEEDEVEEDVKSKKKHKKHGKNDFSFFSLNDEED